MLHAKIPDGFFDFGDTGLDGDACALILEKMDDDVCGRFLGNPTVGYEYSETTAAHEVRTYETVERMINHVVRDPQENSARKNHYKAMIMLHDVSDVLKEVIVASTETDPVLAQQCFAQLLNYDLTVTPFIYKLALFSKAEGSDKFFADVIDSLRNDLLDPAQHGRGFSMAESIAFCDASVSLVKQREMEFNSFRNWNAPGTDQKITIAMQYYNEIERTSSFAGLQSQIQEKSDGTEYACRISTVKNGLGQTPTHYHSSGNVLNRINGRYEKKLNPLVRSAKSAQEKALAACTLHHCYNISQTVYHLGKEYTCLTAIPGEPCEIDSHEKHLDFVAKQKTNFDAGDKTIHPRQKLIDLYGEAKQDLARGTLWLPEDNKTLAESATFQKIKMGKQAMALSSAYLHSAKL